MAKIQEVRLNNMCLYASILISASDLHKFIYQHLKSSIIARRGKVQSKLINSSNPIVITTSIIASLIQPFAFCSFSNHCHCLVIIQKKLLLKSIITANIDSSSNRKWKLFCHRKWVSGKERKIN